MKKFNWNVTAFDFSNLHRGTHRLQIEEAEDSISGASELLKQARMDNIPEPVDVIITELIIDLGASLDKIRKVRSDLKNL